MEEKELIVSDNKIENKKQDNVVESTNKHPNMIVPKNMSDYINNTLINYQERGLTFPEGYNFTNEVLLGYLKIVQDPKLNICDKTSIQNCLLDMASLGLSMAKSQCYPIPYGNKLMLQMSYFGKQAIVKRIKGVIDVRSDVIYKNTEYELFSDDFGNDDIKVIKPCPLESRKDEDIIGAWGRIILDENVWGSKSYTCIMTMEQIKNSWSQGQQDGKGKPHINFKSEMCRKSVIGRLCKNFVNTCKDNDILMAIYNKVSENDYREPSNIIKEEQVIDV